MIFKETKLQGNFLIDLELKKDERGFFARYFCEKEFYKNRLNTHWVQINNSASNELGTLRGLHYQQEPKAEVKLVRCLKGAIWDVVVDLRDGSKTFGKWFGSKLSDENRTMMYVPKGFAHGFVVTSNDAIVLYKTTQYYSPKSEGTIKYDDPILNIQWPVKIITVSQKDSEGLYIKDTL